MEDMDIKIFLKKIKKTNLRLTLRLSKLTLGYH